MSSGFGVGGAAFRTRKGWTGLVDTVAFPAYTRAAIDLAGPYDEELVCNEDDEYNYRLRSLGARILLAADVRARYYSRGSLGSLFRQYFQYGWWKVRVLQKHPRQMRPDNSCLFVATLFMMALGVPFARAARIGFVGGAGKYVLASLVASASAAVRTGSHWVFLLPVVFAILHLSYGLCSLADLIRFRAAGHRRNVSGRGRPHQVIPN